MTERNLSMLPVIKAFATDPVEARRYAGQAEAVRDIDLRRARLEGAIAPVVHVLGAGAVLDLLASRVTPNAGCFRTPENCLSSIP